MKKITLIGEHHATDYTIIKTEEDIELYHYAFPVNNNQIKKIFLQMEPDAIAPCYTYLNEHKNDYDYIVCYDTSKINSSNTIPLVCGGSWISKDDYMNIDINLKKFQISNLCGTKQFTPSHKLRITLYLYQTYFNNYPIIFYRCPSDGHGAFNSEILPNINNNPIIDKEHKAKIILFKEFQYSIVIENSREPCYFSEKLIDCLITKTIPIYYGCENISEYFNTTGWIILETDNIVQELYEKLQVLNEEYYKKYENIIEKNYRKAIQYSSVLNNSWDALNKIPYINIDISNTS